MAHSINGARVGPDLAVPQRTRSPKFIPTLHSSPLHVPGIGALLDPTIAWNLIISSYIFWSPTRCPLRLNQVGNDVAWQAGSQSRAQRYERSSRC